jgi:hypothetical protein
MKIQLFLFILFFSSKAFSQLTKSVVDLKFPLLNLPYSTKGQLTTDGLIDRPVNLATDKFIKSDVSKELKYYDNRVFYFENNSKCYSLGKIINEGRTYILYVESVTAKDKNYGYNRSYIVPLNKDYQPINFFLLNEYTLYKKENNTLYSGKDTYWDFSIKDKLLYAIAKDARTKFKLEQQVNPTIELKEYKYVFDVNGALKDIK